MTLPIGRERDAETRVCRIERFDMVINDPQLRDPPEILDIVSALESRKRGGGYMSNCVDTLKSWLEFNGVQIQQRIKISRRGSDALVWEAHRIFDNILGHLTRGILDLARANNLFDNAYFEGERDPRHIGNNQLDKIWTEFNLRHIRMIITYEVDCNALLAFVKSNAGKSFLARAFDEFLKRPGRFHKELNDIFYHDAPTPRGRIRMSLPLSPVP